MSRYLTPSKIGLLALISLYTESVVPSVATIPILSFLVSYLLPVDFHDSVRDVQSPDRKFTITINDFQQATITHASGIPGRTVWDLLIKKLWEINSFDALHVFFDTLSVLLDGRREDLQQLGPEGNPVNANQILLSRTSPLGAFVRRAQLEFTRLQFHDGIALWKSLVSYRAPTFALWRKRNPSAGNMSFDLNLQEEHFGSDDQLTSLVYGGLTDEACPEASISTDDMEKLLEYQVDQMQSVLGESCVGALVLIST